MPDLHDPQYPRDLPRFAARVLEFLCPDDRVDYVRSDLDEQFREHCDRLGSKRAHMLLWIELLCFLRPRNRKESRPNPDSGGPIMLSNYLTVARRTLKKHAGYAAINVAGLAVGLACFILIMLFVRYEFSYDRFHADADELYRVLRARPAGDALFGGHSIATSVPLAGTIGSEVPGVEATAQYNFAAGTFDIDGDLFNQRGIYASESFLDVFSFPLVAGSAADALTDPGSVVLTETSARTFFGSEDPIGRIVTYRDYSGDKEFRVSGVVADPPANSTISFEFIFPTGASDWVRRNQDAWSNRSLATFVRLSAASVSEDVAGRITSVVHGHMADDSYYAENPGRRPRYVLQPMAEIHLYSKSEYGVTAGGDIKFVLLFAGIGLLILTIACVNYTNIATARATTRAKEIGVRKVVGARRLHLIHQFVGESVLTSIAAVLIGAGLARVLLPSFNALIQRDIPFPIPGEVSAIAIILGIGLLVGLAAGIYPALVLSKMGPISAFGRGRSSGAAGARLRNILVVGQFAATIALLLVTLIIRGQLVYMLEEDTGLDRDHVITMTIEDRDDWARYAAIRDRISANPAVVDVATSTHMPTRVGTRSGIRDWDGKTTDRQMVAYNFGVRPGFLDFFDIELVEGRAFQEGDEGRGMVINETLRNMLGWDTAVGRRLELGSNGTEVIGVAKDYNFLSLEQSMQPLALYVTETGGRYVHVRVRPEATTETLTFLEEQMAEIIPTHPFTYQFLDEAFASMYESEQRLTRLFGAFTILAVVIACLGLFGLAAFSAARRRREIGVRKVVGASMADIFLLLSKDFTRLVLIAFLIASPISYYLMQQWLESFAYRISPAPMLFLLVGGFSVLVAWITVAYQAISAARTRPVNVLSSE